MQYIFTEQPGGLYALTTSGPTPTPAPTPTPTPTPTPPPGVIEFTLGVQVWIDQVQPGMKYTAKLPFPFPNDGSVNIAAGRGTAPTAILMAISTTPGGGIGSPYPQGVSGDVNAGLPIYASLNPVAGRGGYYQARVIPGVQNYITFVCPNDGGGVVVQGSWYS